MQFWPPFLRICRGKPQIRGRVSHVLIWTDRISGGLGLRPSGSGGVGYMRAYLKSAFMHSVRDVVADVGGSRELIVDLNVRN